MDSKSLSHTRWKCQYHIVWWYDDKDDLPAARMAKILRIPLSVFEGVVNLIKEHPDWDDETVADKADWR